VQYSTVKYSTFLYSTVQYSTVQYLLVAMSRGILSSMVFALVCRPTLEYFTYSPEGEDRRRKGGSDGGKGEVGIVRGGRRNGRRRKIN
jgi:hypothetical protein